MEENTPKLSLIEKIQKNLIMRKLKKNDFTAYQNITSEALKNDEEILKLAWEIAKPENYHEFPENYQKKKIEQETRIGETLKYYSPNIQEQRCLKIPTILMSSSPEIQLKLGPNYPELIGDLNKEVQLQIALENNELLNRCSNTVQERAIEQKPELIYHCSYDIKNKKIIRESNGTLLELYVKNPNFSDNDVFFLDLLNNKPTEETKKVCISMLLDSKMNKLEIIKKEMLSIFQMESHEKCSIETQNKIYEILKSIPGIYTRYENFSKSIILTKLSEIYGNKKLKEYKDFIDKLYKKYPLEKQHILSIFLNEKSSIIEKVEPKKVINFFEEYLNEEKTKERKSNHEAKAYYYNEFYDLIKEAYGKEALEILKERPGLNFEDIDNLEVFSNEVLSNFDKGFIHDLLSYDFGQEGFDITKIAKNPKDLHAFKFYYSRMSNIMGENATTMKISISRYREFKDILIEASNQNLTEEQLQKLDALCTWPKNIANITKIEELNYLDEKLKEKITTATNEKKEIFTDLNKLDFFNINLEYENILFSYLNPSKDVLDMLSKEEINILNYLKGTNLLMEIKSIEDQNKLLTKLIDNNIPLSKIFSNKYKLLTKIKNIEMTYFQEKVITGRKEIEKAIKEGKYGVKKIQVDGIEIIDLGTMPVNFAIHNPHWNQSRVKKDIDKIEDDYLTLENQSGTSTISARAEWENDYSRRYEKNGYYVYWNFDNNEIMAFKGNGNTGDSYVSPESKLVKSAGITNKPLREYKIQTDGTEIAFYRRYRKHKKIEENPRYGGKIIPDAIFVSEITPEMIQIPTKIFGKNITIICRGKLQTEEQIKRVTEMIKAQKQIQMFNQTFDKTEETIHSIGR